MRRFRNILLIALALFTADIARYLFLPDISRLAEQAPAESSYMAWRKEGWRRSGYSDRRMHHRWVPFERISPDLVAAVLIAEDDKFWSHNGFDFPAMRRALHRNLKEGRLAAGGSTITQQLARNLYLTPSKNPVRKVKEALLAWRLERALSKRRMLELYLNYAEWGDGIFGIEAAARRYYGRPASRLSRQQAARLAAILPNPIRWSPEGGGRTVRNRSRRILAIMEQREVRR